MMPTPACKRALQVAVDALESQGFEVVDLWVSTGDRYSPTLNSVLPAKDLALLKA